MYPFVYYYEGEGESPHRLSEIRNIETPRTKIHDNCLLNVGKKTTSIAGYNWELEFSNSSESKAMIYAKKDGKQGVGEYLKFFSVKLLPCLVKWILTILSMGGHGLHILG